MDKKKIGVVVAVELDAVLSRYGKAKNTESIYGYTVHIYENEKSIMYVLDSGVGEIAAAAGTQLLICHYGVELIINFGVVGALTKDMKTAELCIVRKLIHYDFDVSSLWDLELGQYPNEQSRFIRPDKELFEKALEINPELRPVTCASADKFVDGAEKKSKLHESFGADICEMESAGIALICKRSAVPCLMIKAVSDSLTGGGAEFESELERVSLACFDTVDKIIKSMV